MRNVFSDKFNEYMDLTGCSGKEFSEYSGISEATISRYRTGERAPKSSSADMKRLCRGICIAAEKKGIAGITYKTVEEELNALLRSNEFDYESLRTRFNMLCSVLNVNAAEMSKNLKYDSSYVSRIRSGKRKPSKPEKFAFDVAEYIVRCYDSVHDRKILSEFISETDIKTESEYTAALTKWLTDGENGENIKNPVTDFLEKLDEFDLNEYIRAIRFDELKVPSLPFQLPTSKSYYGVEEMKNGELDFLKATALSKSKQSVFMCSDMQMDDMAADMEFSKKYMFGLAAMLKKGLHLNVVHNLNRPFNEIMLGFECWIPLYMTGQISPYYIKGVHNHVYCHFLNVSGAAALTGESISGYHSKGKYYLTKNREELAYYSERAECIMKKALPLMEIYREDSAGGLNAFLLSDVHTDGKRKNILSALPIYTSSEEFLKRFLEKRNVSGDEKQKIMLYASARKRQALEILQHNSVLDEIPYLTEKEFKEQPVSLSLSLMFFGRDFEYSYEEYTEHLELTKKFAKENHNYSAARLEQNAFRNIQIMIHENEYVMISKNKAPTIHFVIRHPILIEAIEKLDFQVL